MTPLVSTKTVLREDVTSSRLIKNQEQNTTKPEETLASTEKGDQTCPEPKVAASLKKTRRKTAPATELKND